MWKQSSLIAPPMIAIAALFASGSASAEPCRSMPSVVASATVGNNTASGGHLTQHIEGATPPPGASQIGKTLFEAPGKFNTVWAAYTKTNRITPVNCAGKQAQQEVPLEQLGIRFLGALSCKEVGADLRCKKWDSYMAKSVFFGFILRNGHWILNTAFPEPLQ